jgi:hypothetical protein
MTIRPKATIERQLHQTLQVFDFDQVAMRLRAEPAWHSGRNAITLRKAAALQCRWVIGSTSIKLLDP